MFLWTSFAMVGVKFPILYVWPATDIKCLIFPVIMRMHFAFASDRTQTHLVDFRKISVTRIRKNPCSILFHQSPAFPSSTVTVLAASQGRED